MSLKVNDVLISNELIDLCYKCAENGLNSGEVPVGCVFVRHNSDDHKCGTVLATAHNRTNALRNALRHAEMECIDVMVDTFGANTQNFKQVMAETTVLLTLEPCLMCVRALRALEVRQVLFGAKNDRFGGSGSVYDVNSRSDIKDPILNCYEVLDSNKSIQLLQLFYEQNNESAPKPYIKKLKTK